MLAEADAADAAEDASFGVEATGEGPPAQLRGATARRARFVQAKAQLDAADEQAQKAHQDTLAARTAAEKTSGKKTRGPKPKPPSEATQAKANNLRSGQSDHENQKRLRAGLQRPSGGHRKADRGGC
jgi:hypothetical protein